MAWKKIVPPTAAEAEKAVSSTVGEENRCLIKWLDIQYFCWMDDTGRMIVY